MGNTYNVSKVIEKAHDFTFNETSYQAYSDVSGPDTALSHDLV